MKTKTLLIAAAALAAGVISSEAQVYSQNIVGYANVKVLGGQYNMGCNPFATGTNGANNVFGTQLPDGTQLFQWNGTGFDVSLYDTSIGASPDNWYNGGGDAIIPIPVVLPGQGYFLLPPSGHTFTNTFSGTIAVNVGASVTNSTISGGQYNMVGSTIPAGGAVTNSLIGLYPPNGTQLFQWAGTGFNVSLYDTSIGASPDNWYNGGGDAIVPIPTIAVGEGFFLLPPSGPGYKWKQTLQ